MNMIDWAKHELTLAGYGENLPDDNMNKWMRDATLKLLEAFCDEGHSGGSAPFAISLFQRLASWKPISPLTGADDEWNKVGTGVWQNRRASNIFKDETGAYWIDGIVFWEWYTDPDTGKKHKSYFTSRDSRVPITFPFMMPDEPEYRERME